MEHDAQCVCELCYESWAQQVITYILLMLLAGTVGFYAGAQYCA